MDADLDPSILHLDVNDDGVEDGNQLFMISGAGLCWQHVGGVGSTTTTTTW